MSGIFIAKANAFEKEEPTKSAPNNPGPRVKATALISFLLILAFEIAVSTTGIMFC